MQINFIHSVQKLNLNLQQICDTARLFPYRIYALEGQIKARIDLSRIFYSDILMLHAINFSVQVRNSCLNIISFTINIFTLFHPIPATHILLELYFRSTAYFGFGRRDLFYKLCSLYLSCLLGSDKVKLQSGSLNH